MSRRAYRLLDLDPQLGQLLAEDRIAEARDGLLVRVAALPGGEWDTSALGSGVRAGHLGLLVLTGVVAHEIVMGGVVSTELLGPGDVVRPWGVDPPQQLVPRTVRWNVLSECRVAILDRDTAAQLARWPEVNAALVDRLDERAQRLATAQAISQLTRVDRRVLALLWHLAERWGRVTPDGVRVPLTLSHRMLGQLVGARRPTVSTAVRALTVAGALTRRGDGTWVLHGEPPDFERPGVAERVIPIRRRLQPARVLRAAHDG